MGRHEISSSPYFFHAQYADSITGISNFVKSINDIAPDDEGNIVFSPGENITITEITDSNKIRIDSRDYPHPHRVILGDDLTNGALFARNTAGQQIARIETTNDSTQGILANTIVNDRAAIIGNANGSGISPGVLGLTNSKSTDAAGVKGIAMNSAADALSHGVIGITYAFGDNVAGVHGTADGEGLGYGVYGKAGDHSADNSVGILGEAMGTHLSYGAKGITHSSTDDACGVLGQSVAISGARTFGVKGVVPSTGEGSAGVRGEATSTSGLVNGVTGITNSIQGIGVEGFAEAISGTTFGVKGVTCSSDSSAAGVLGWADNISNASAAIIGRGDLRIYDRTEFFKVFTVRTGGIHQVNIYELNELITAFGGPTRRVPIQKVNTSATPTIPDNNFNITGDSPITVTTGAHGVTIGCPDCCTEPCGAGGIACRCDSTLTVGSSSHAGVINVKTATGEVAVKLTAADVAGPKVKSSVPATADLLSVARFEAYQDTPYDDSDAKAAIKGYWNSGSPTGHGVFGFTSSGESSAGVFGKAGSLEEISPSYGVSGVTEGNGPLSAGVYGEAMSTTAQVYGVSGHIRSESPNSAGLEGRAFSETGVVFGVSGYSMSSGTNSSGVYGEGEASTGTISGVRGITRSSGDYSSGVSGEAILGTGKIYGVLGKTNSSDSLSAGLMGWADSTGQSAGLLSSGDLRVCLTGGPESPTVFTISVANEQVNMYQASELITAFGGFDRRVAIQKVNSVATPTIPDNNFTITADAPITVTTSAHGVNISCEDCCTEPCGGGGDGCNCDSTLKVGSASKPGGAQVINSSGNPALEVSQSGTMCNLNVGGIGSHGEISIYDNVGDYAYINLASWGAYFAVHTGFEDITVEGSADVDWDLNVGGDLNLDGDLIMDYEKYLGCNLIGWAHPDYPLTIENNVDVNGNLDVTGTVSKAGGSFLIDHPLDPLNKTLRHNFVESPENLCLYRGEVILDEYGEGSVKMPDYFSALTKEGEASVTPTPVGKPFMVGYEWNDEYTQFKLYGEPGRKVTYIVLADRDDPVMHEIYRPVEEEKGNGHYEKGKLLYPEAYGYLMEMGVHYQMSRNVKGASISN
ncbi:hypothetical protein JXI42_02955 [bacterium]|nr:hypothetical protein [bacterium]